MKREQKQSCDRNAGKMLGHISAGPCRKHDSQLAQRLTPTHYIRILEEAGRKPRSPPSPVLPPGRKADQGNGVLGSSNVTADIQRWAATCFVEGQTSSEEQIQCLMQEASEAARDDYGVESAKTWAGGYQFPEEYIRSDISFLKSQMLDFTSMVRRRLTQLSHDRLSNERVDKLREDNPERTLMFELVGGMKVHRPEGFVPNGSHPRTPLRSTYESVATAVNKMLGAVVEQKLAFLIPLDIAQRHVPELHLCKAHWCTKKGKASGRPLGDLSYVDGTPLNTDETAEAATRHYGQILHPTIDEIAIMIYTFWAEAKKKNPRLRWTDLRLWKMDLKGAYTLLSFRPEDAGLFGMLLTGDLVYLQIAGIFGWAGTPAAFQVVTRAISWELKYALRSSTLMYVDDIIGVCFADDVEQDLAKTREICTSLLGSGAVADDKTETGLRLDIIGYTIDLESKRVSIAKKNFLTALHGFIGTDVTKRLNLRTAQRLASWGTRYGKICRVMRPFCGALNALTWGRKDPHALFSLTPTATVAIQCWRAMLCLVRYREAEFTRTIESFVPTVPVSVAEFDASLSGAGLIWYAIEDGAEVARGVSAVDLTFLGFGTDSSFQNLSEFIGAILAVMGQIILGRAGPNFSLALRGDSVTALTWSITERVRGSIVTNASMVWTLLCVAADVNVTEIIHIAGSDNKNCDRLSRREAQSITTIQDDAKEMGLDGVEVVEVNGEESVMGVLRLCVPRRELITEGDFVEFWSEVREAVSNFLFTHPIHIP